MSAPSHKKNKKNIMQWDWAAAAAAEMRNAGLGQDESNTDLLLGRERRLPANLGGTMFEERSEQLADDDSTVNGESEFEFLGEEAVPEEPESSDVAFSRPTTARLNEAFAQLDVVDLRDIFKCKVGVMQGIPSFARQQYRNCQKLALKRIHQSRMGTQTERSRAWKLLLLLSRILLLPRR